MRIGQRTLARAVFVACVMLAMVFSSLPGSTAAMGGLLEQGQLHDDADAYPGHAEGEDAAVERHCHPSLDCQIASVVLNNPDFLIHSAAFVFRFTMTGRDGQSLTVAFDLPPPRSRS